MISENEMVELDPSFPELFEPAARAPCQLYIISPARIGSGFADALKAALDGGPVAAFQLRLKDVPDDEVLRVAELLMPVCAERETAFILNDRTDLAKACGADGVHLGQSDGDPREARLLLGPSAQIGRTCHDSRHLAMEAGEAGVDYVAFGAFYPTKTHATTYRPDPSILGWWSRLFEIPCVAIGGINPENGMALVQAGADFLAVCSWIWEHEHGPGAAVKAFEDVLAPGLPTRKP